MSNKKRNFEEDRETLQEARAVLEIILGTSGTLTPRIAKELQEAILHLDYWIVAMLQKNRDWAKPKTKAKPH